MSSLPNRIEHNRLHVVPLEEAHDRALTDHDGTLATGVIAPFDPAPLAPTTDLLVGGTSAT